MELYRYTASELAEMLKQKKCSDVEIIDDCLSRIEQTDDNIKAFLRVTKDAAKQQAIEVDKALAKGEPTHPLLGIPIALKDNLCTDGVNTTCASKMLENFIPPYSATVVDKLAQCGAIVMGKLNMDEFAMGSGGETSHFQITKNPHDITRVPGGSSSGSAACVSAGQVPLSLGTDTGGSIRLPSSFCGVIGLKPTYGSVSRYGVIAFASSLDQVGPIGRSVSDVAMLYEAICGKDPKDATSHFREYPDFVKLMKADVKDKVIGLPKELFSDLVEDEVKVLVEQVAQNFAKQGARLKEISLPSTPYALNAYCIISSAEASSNLARFDGIKYGYRTKEYDSLLDLYEKSRSEGFGTEVKRRILLGTFVLNSGYYDAYYKRAKFLQQKLTDEFTQQLAECDLILTPTAPNTAFSVGAHDKDPLALYATDLCTTSANITGLPAISFPCGKAQNGMPVGCQLMGKHFSEQQLFNAVYCYEQNVGAVCEIASC